MYLIALHFLSSFIIFFPFFKEFMLLVHVLHVDENDNGVGLVSIFSEFVKCERLSVDSS